MADKEPLADVLLERGENPHFRLGVEVLFSPSAGKETSHLHDRKVADFGGAVLLDIALNLFGLILVKVPFGKRAGVEIDSFLIGHHDPLGPVSRFLSASGPCFYEATCGKAWSFSRLPKPGGRRLCLA